MGSVTQHSTTTNIMKSLVFLGVIAVALGAPHDIGVAHVGGLVGGIAHPGLIGGVAHTGLVGAVPHAVGYTAAQVGVAPMLSSPLLNSMPLPCPLRRLRFPSPS